MTIGKKLYAGFGLILAILAVLFLVNLVTGYLEKSARNNAQMALDSVRRVESVRYQIMLNRLNMNNFLLSGDPHDEDKVRSEEHTSELQSRFDLVCRLLLEKKKY